MKHFIYLLLVFIFLNSCKTTNSITFKSPVDTTSRQISYQEKKTYFLESLGLYANNEFDGARLNGLEKLNDSTALIIINPENTPINNSPYYAFSVWANASKPFYFKFKYPKGYKHRYIPKLKIDDKWAVIDSTHVFKNDSIVTIKLNLTKEPQILSAQEIQSSKDVYNWYSKLIEENSDVVKFKKIGKTPLGRDLPVLNISIGDTKGKDVIVLLTRQHPPEITGYYAYQHFLETILSESNLSIEFLKKYHVLAFPIMNPDGVDLGHWRHNSGGVDTNRDWSVYNQPEIKQAIKYLTKVLKKNKSKIVLGIDFHSTYNDVFYTNSIRKTTALPNFIEDWFSGIEANIPNYKVNEAPGNSAKPVSKGWFLYGHNAVGITYEIGDATPKNRIETIGRISAEQMMKILNKS